MKQEIIDLIDNQIQQENRELYGNHIARLESDISDVDELWEVMKTLGCYVAGGYWTSIFTNTEVNDIDVYFRSKESLEWFLKSAFGEAEGESPEKYEDLVDIPSYGLRCIGYTDKSIMFTTKNSGQQVQLIHNKFYESAEDIFNTFDYTINMCAYDFKKDLIIMDDRFPIDVMARRLVVNTNTSFPIISQLRIDKYKQRGYSINRKEFLKLSIAVARLELKTWDQAMKQLAGMYGWCIDELFDTTKEFSIEELLLQLEDLEFNKQQVKPFEPINDLSTLLEGLDEINETPDPDKEYFYYKKVNKTSDPNVFKSQHNNNFTYVIGEKVQCDKRGIFVFKSARKAEEFFMGDTVIKLTSGKQKAKLLPDSGGGKYSTNSELTVVGVVNDKGFTKPSKGVPVQAVPNDNFPY